MRGVAALLVVLYHLTTNAAEKFGTDFLGGAFLFGYAGVDFFFVLSGFIIYYVHHRDIGDVQRIGPYFAKRVTRIYPVYWLVTLAVLPLYFLFPHFGNGYERDAGVILKSLLLIPQAHNPIISVAWTLVHEMLFYVLFAAAIAIGRRAIVLALAWAFASAIINDAYLFSGYNLEFLMGVLAAHLVLAGYRPRVFLAGCAAFLGMGLLEAFDIFSTSRILAYGIPAALVVVGAARLDLAGVKVPRFAFLIGEASYSIYLVHSIAIAALVKVGAAWMMPLIGVAAVLAGVALHLLAEKPILGFARKRLPGAAVAHA